MGIIKLFELELTAIQTSKELDLNKTTVQRIYTKIREAITLVNPNANTSNSNLKDTSNAFIIEIEHGIVNITLASVGDQNTRDLFTVKRTRVPNKEALFKFYHNSISARKIDNKLNDMPTIQNHFWRYANHKLRNFRGTKLKSLYLFLKEIEFRYNNQSDLFNQLTKKIAEFKNG